MKNKGMTYLLGAAVAIVWGLIIYKVFYAIAEAGGNDYIPTQGVSKKADFNDFSLTADTGHLLLNYRDPFGLAAPPDTVSKRADVITSKATGAVVPKPEFSWNFITYSGYVRGSGKKLLALVAINGKSVTLQEGESADQVKLIKNYQDSIKVSFKGKTGTIRMQ